jgi:predicted ATP-grasp superfamily ATP-dependent carboligase
MKNVLILDANERSALAATRALGRLGIQIFTADESEETLAGNSRYSYRSIVYPSPYYHPEKFISSLQQSVETYGIDILLPMTDATTSLVLKHKGEFFNTSIPFPEVAAYEAVTNKFNLFKTAERAGIPVPMTLYCDNARAFRNETIDISFPVAIKPIRSKIFSNGRIINTAVKYARSAEELNRVFKNYDWLQNHPFMVQQYINGHGQGIFLLCDRGKLIAAFAHKRLREKPPSGGVSVLSQSIQVQKPMLQIAMKLLGPLQWHGVAMVEFKVSPDGTPYLMEINGRFWGSLQLAIDAGVNFPLLLYRIACGQTIEPLSGFQTGKLCRWLLGDLDHLYMKLKSDSGEYSLIEKLAAIGRFIIPWQPGLHYEINRLNDIRPFLFELKNYFRQSRHSSSHKGAWAK